MIRSQCTIESLEGRLFLAAQAYDWNNVNIGAGGFVDGVFFDPTKQNVVYARTDIGGLYKTTNGGGRWQELLDFANNTTSNSYQQMGVLSFAMDPRNTDRIFVDAGMYTSRNGWVLRSSDGGHTFAQTDLPFYVGGNSNGRGTGERLAVDPNLGNTLFLGSNGQGLYKSTDGAASFSQVASFPLSTAEVTFVYFDPRSGTAGNASQEIYVGVGSTAAGTNIYRTTNGGTTWSVLPGGPTGLMPMQASLASDGNLYFTFASALPPGGSLTTGGLWRYNTSTSAWKDISPQIPGGSNPTFSYDGLAVDPQNPNAVVVTSFNRYSGPDTMWRTANASATTPTWIQLFDQSSAQNSGYGGFNTTRDTSTAPWVAAYGDGIGNWASSVAIDPFNSAHLMYTTGQGIWATDHANSATKLTAANSWYFPDTGIEFTAVLKIVAPPSGAPLFSAMGDINGFAHTSLTSSPTGRGIGATITSGGLGTMNSIDFAQSNPNILAIVGQAGARHGAYTTNNGATWTEFAASPNANAAVGGSVAVGANGATFMWAPTGLAPFYSTDNGATWTPAVLPAGTLTGGTVVADRANASRFYYWTENSSNNQWILYISTDGGQTFTKGATLVTGSVKLVPNPSTEGDLWISTNGGIYRSTNFGFSFTQNSSVGSPSITALALGKPAAGQSYPAIYIHGTSGTFKGVFRSIDAGLTWNLINDTAHQWGGLVKTMAADPNVFGRVYIGLDGRGIVYGDIHSTPASLPAGWTSQDIGTPASTGAAGVAASTWELVGGGAGVAGNADQFRYAYTTLTGNGSITALVSDVPNGGPGSYLAKAGLMIRDGVASNSTNAFLALTPGSVNGAIFQTRASSGATTNTIASATTGVWPPYWLRLRRAGNVFSASISPDGITWTAVGSPQTIAMSAQINIGLAVSASDNNQVDISHFQNVSIATPPSVTARSYLSNTSLNKLSFTFDKDVSASLLAGNLTVSPGGIVASSVSWDAATLTATFTLPMPLDDGDYTATLSGAATKNLAGDSMLASDALSFFVLQGDANRDRAVNALDFNTLAGNFGAPGNHTLADGDFSHDGNVDSADFTLLADQFGKSLPGQGPAAEASVLSASSMNSGGANSDLTNSSAISSAATNSAATSFSKPNLFGSTPVNLSEDVLGNHDEMELNQAMGNVL